MFSRGTIILLSLLRRVKLFYTLSSGPAAANRFCCDVFKQQLQTEQQQQRFIERVEKEYQEQVTAETVGFATVGLEAVGVEKKQELQQQLQSKQSAIVAQNSSQCADCLSLILKSETASSSTDLCCVCYLS
ncbi:hypothetical protein Ccrd_017262 [Cynara cardunculus var. scolymus]|uniref:Uncharacterized protein n=1 Tax=Cynara cardunculus var. scolymus TaxID=59895 RepID=A0A103Y8E7_CYNCS|nr:hypothetical protein Ccrd_017262 [Cynara cardunculus var. scolymus]